MLRSRPASELEDRNERAVARIAMVAACDAINGGARALTILRRLTRSPNYGALNDAVTASYHSSHPPTEQHKALECPECGSVWLGAEAAYACCFPTHEE